MTHRLPVFAAAAVLAATLATTTSATPLSGALALKSAAPSNLENVRWGGGGFGGRGWGGGGWRGGGGGWRGGWRGPGWGWGVGAGVVGGAIIGARVASCWRWAPTPYGWTQVWVC
jgi:hypothetical protein